MNVVCLDLEGVLVPEIWIAFAEESGISVLTRTTRDEPDYDKLMKWRLEILREHGLTLKDIQATIAKIDPLPGAKEFLDKLRSLTQTIIVSDTFTQFAQPLMEKLGMPTIFCNELVVDADGINEIASHMDIVRERRYPTVFTPHPGEFSTMGGDTAADRVTAAKRMAEDLGITLVLKGHKTVVTNYNGEIKEYECIEDYVLDTTKVNLFYKKEYVPVSNYVDNPALYTYISKDYITKVI